MTGTLRCYSVYGERLASAIPLPELDEIPPGPARWTVETSAALAPVEDVTELGADLIYGSVHARLYAHARGHRIVVEDTGVFDLSHGGSRVTVVPFADGTPDFVRAHLTGRVLATALWLDGLLPLHASAVAMRDGVVGILAPKGFGKSSLALALTQAGGWLVSDDTLPVEADSGRAWPGLHGLRVHDDAREVLGVAAGRLRTAEGKHVITELGRERLFARPMALSALYLLVPVEPDGEGVDRVAIAPMQAAISVVGHVKVGGLLGRSGARAMLERAVRVTTRTPVFQLRVPRDLAALPGLARTILSWHGEPAP